MELAEHLLAREHLHLGAVGLDHVDRVAPALRLGDDALHHLFREGAPELDLDAVFLLERLGERRRLGRRERRVEDEPALLLRLLDEAGVAVRAAIAKNRVVTERGLARVRRRQDEGQEQAVGDLHDSESDDRFGHAMFN